MNTANRDNFINHLATAYDTAATSWFLGASVVYQRLADEVVALVPSTTDGPVLDLCAGTGAASTALRRHCGPVVAVDLSPGMLAVRRHLRPPAVVADALVMPFCAGTFGLVVSTCGLNHAPDPVAFLTEVARVTRPGGTILASTFAGGWSHHGKAAVDDALRPFGFRPPAWHERFKNEIEPATADPSSLIALSTQVGLTQSSVTRMDVAVDLSIEEVVAWRFSMASHAAFVIGLSSHDHQLATIAATKAVRQCWEPVVIPLLVLSAAL